MLVEYEGRGLKAKGRGHIIGPGAMGRIKFAGSRISKLKVITQKCNSSANLQRSSLVWAVLENVALSETAI